MRSVLFVITTLRRTGPVNILYDLVKYLDKSVYSAHVLTLCPEEGDSRWNEFEDLGVVVSSLKLPRSWRSFSNLSIFRATVDEINPDVVHCFCFRADMLGALFLGKYKKITSQLNFPFDDYVMTYGRLIGGGMAHLTRWAVTRYDVPVACATEVAVKFRRKGVKCKIIHNAIDLARFVPVGSCERRLARGELNLWNDADIVFIFVGVLTDRKQPLVALEAFIGFLKQFPQAAMIVLGDGPLSEECRRLAAGHRVMFFGNVSDTRPYLAASDIYVATSKAEGMPVSVLEAMALQLPIILSDIEPHKEILSLGVDLGLVTTTGSVGDTLTKMIALVSRDLAVMGQNARAVIARDLNSRVMAERYEKIYAELH